MHPRHFSSDIFFPHTLLNPPNVQDCSKGLLLLCRGEAGAMAPEVGDGEEGGSDVSDPEQENAAPKDSDAELEAAIA